MKVFLTICVGVVAYASLFVLMKYMENNDCKFFQCTLSILVPNSGPYGFEDQSIAYAEDLAKLLIHSSMWLTLGMIYYKDMQV